MLDLRINQSKLNCGLYVTSAVSVSEAAVSQSKDVGTSFYISPEQNNKECYGKMVDVYALGVIYFEMNCPFGSNTERCKVIIDYTCMHFCGLVSVYKCYGLHIDNHADIIIFCAGIDSIV